MKKCLLLIGFLLFSVAVFCQDFEDYFIDKTLRINYLHIGDADSEAVRVVAFFSGNQWTGTRVSLVEPTRLGDVLLEVFDSVSNKLIFSRSYSCLFNEYRTTERALSESAEFQESVNIPFPKNTVKLVLSSFDRKKEVSKLYDAYFNPKLADVQEFTKEYSTLDLHIGGNPKRCLDILFLPDGYAKSDAKKLHADMKRFADYIMKCAPYRDLKNRVNIRAVEAYSDESGITNPLANVMKSTLFNSSYNSIDVDRYLMCLNVWKMHDVADDAPYDILVLIANSSKYGGGGIYNFYATVNSDHNFADYVIVHELGHTVAGLADEYFSSEVSVTNYYPEGIEPVEPNLTTLVDFDSKWKSMLPDSVPVPTPDIKFYDNKLGVFEGGGYQTTGVFRPWRNCTMKNPIYDNFCPVCLRAIENAIFYFSE